MSSIKLESNASGTGVFTIASPNSNTNRTLTLPDNTGTIITTAGGAAISGTTGTFTGLVDISAAGAGQIKFPATQNASSDANTLDDYEEGTWTPVLKCGTSTPTITIYNNTYVKIGRTVTINMNIYWASQPTGGRVYITGLPFAKETGQTVGVIATCSAGTITTAEALFYNIDSGGTVLNLAGQSGDINSTSLAGAGYLSCTGTYFV